MTVYPEFYDAFQCTADRCRHTCCRGWEIEIDPNTAVRYRAMPGPLGERLRANIKWDAEGASFHLAEDERCPFLRDDGLCDLIRETGSEDILCDVCALHPRFYTEVGDVTLAGLGLCCEEACRLLLVSEAPLRFRTETGPAVAFAELVPRAFKPEQLRFQPRTDPESIGALLETYARTEPINAAWTAGLDALRADVPACSRAAEAFRTTFSSAVFDRILHHILYRQLDRLETDGPDALAGYAQDAVRFIFLAAAVTGELPEAVRSWSEQIEYSTENVEVLLVRKHERY